MASLVWGGQSGSLQLEKEEERLRQFLECGQRASKSSLAFGIWYLLNRRETDQCWSYGSTHMCISPTLSFILMCWLSQLTTTPLLSIPQGLGAALRSSFCDVTTHSMRWKLPFPTETVWGGLTLLTVPGSWHLVCVAFSAQSFKRKLIIWCFWPEWLITNMKWFFEYYIKDLAVNLPCLTSTWLEHEWR